MACLLTPAPYNMTQPLGDAEITPWDVGASLTSLSVPDMHVLENHDIALKMLSDSKRSVFSIYTWCIYICYQHIYTLTILTIYVCMSYIFTTLWHLHVQILYQYCYKISILSCYNYYKRYAQPRTRPRPANLKMPLHAGRQASTSPCRIQVEDFGVARR